MFTVKTSNGKEFKISFRYSTFESTANGKQRITTCLMSDGNKAVEGTTFCHPRDIFSKKLGRKRALTRAIAFFNLNKTDRKLIWDEYFNHHKK